MLILGYESIHQVLQEAGIWSVEQIAGKPIPSLPGHITENSESIQRYRLMKDRARLHTMLPLYLQDHGLSNYAALSSYLDLSRLAHKYPGEINDEVFTLEHLDSKRRNSLRADVHKFKEVVLDFVRNGDKSLAIISQKDEYAKKITSWYGLFGQKIHSLLKDEKQCFNMAIFTAISCLVLWLSLPTGQHLHGGRMLPILISYWLNPAWGRLNIFTMLLVRSVWEPAKMLLMSGVLSVWMLAANDVIDSPLVVIFSVVPSLTFMCSISILHFHPLVVEEEESKLYDVTISGIGYLDNRLQKFIKTPKISWIRSKLGSIMIPKEIDWGKVQRLKTDEVDVSWSVIHQMLESSLEKNNLKEIWLADNHNLTNDDAVAMATTISNSKSLHTLRVTYNRKFSLVDLLYRLLLWNQNPIRFDKVGAITIVQAIADIPKSPIKTLDFCGVQLDNNFVAKAKELRKSKDINILVNKHMITSGKSKIEIFIIICNVICMLMTISYCLFNIIDIIQGNTKNDFYETWVAKSLLEIVEYCQTHILK